MMAIKLLQGFNITSDSPIDSRVVLTKSQMASVDDAKMPANYFALCSDDNQLYVYDKNAVTDSETGKFKSLNDCAPVPTESTAGPVKSCSDIDSITVNADGTMEVNQITTDKLVNSAVDVLVIDGGSAPMPEDS